MATNRVHSAMFDPLAPIAWLGAGLFDTAAYVGGIGVLGFGALKAVLAPRRGSPPFLAAVVRHTDQMLCLGLPLVAVVNIGMGSFLSMQAYFGATFVDGTGAVVGVGLIRNLAPLMVGLTISGLFAAKIVPELRGDRTALDRDNAWVPDRLSVQPNEPIEPTRLAASRIVAGMLVGPILSIWGVLVGTLVGIQVARSLLGVTFSEFLATFLGMIWTRDIVGLVAKGILFGGIAALFACYEGLVVDDRQTSTAARVCRAISLAGLIILVANSGWFLLVYHSGPAFGPTLLKPPAR